jgi:hypothetical protein
VGPINAPALAEMTKLLEQPGHHLLPDAVWLGGRADVFKHLRDVEALSLSHEIADAVLCPDCMSGSIRPEQTPHGSPIGVRAYCCECGWVQLPKERARLWQASPTKVAEWLNVALGLKSRYSVTEVIKGVLWHLGEREFKRRRHSLFFGCQLVVNQDGVGSALDQSAAPGSDVIITTSDIVILHRSRLGSRIFVPLGAVAQLRKGGLVIENLEAYVDGIAPAQASDETSLRLLEAKQVALIGGVEVSLSPQVFKFLRVLLEADGDEVHKRLIAKALEIPENFRFADIKKRHAEVFATFVESDRNGYYWLHPDYLPSEGG